MANTVYTESVVTLNASQAEATMNALKSSADDLRKKMIEATKLGNTEDAAKYQKQLDQVTKSMKSIKKETKDYSDLMKNLNGANLNTLAKAYSNLNKQIKNLAPGTQEFIEKSKQLRQVKSRMDEINQSVKGTNKTLDSLKGMLPKLGLATFFAAAGKAVIQFGKDAISQTQLIGDRWGQFTSGLRSAYNTFVADLSSGKGWRELIQDMRDSYQVGKEVAAMLDEIFERQNSLSLKEAEYNVEIEKNKQLMKDTSKSDEERLAAAEEAMRLERELAEERKEIAKQEADARKLELQDRTKLSDADLEFYIKEYNQNRDILLQAQAYNAELRKRENAVKAAQSSAMWARDAYSAAMAGQRISEAQKALRDYIDTADAGLKRVAEMDAKYQLSNDELVDNYVKATVKMSNADADYYRSTTRTVSTINSLRKDISSNRQKAADDAFKKELADVDKHQKEMEVKAKEAYASGEISEREYQSRLITIQETALKSKKAIAERYKKDTIEYQSQLLDLTIKQQAELKKTLKEAEKDAMKVFDELAKKADEELKAVMAEIDADLQKEIDHMLELAGKAQEVKDALDPSSALGRQLQEEITSLQEMYDQRLLTEEEFQKAKQDLVKRYMKENLQIELDAWQSGMTKASSIIEQASQSVTALQDAEMAHLDARMQAELTAAGDNAEAKEEIEAKYEQKKLETQKKYAVADMVINIAKTIAAGALAVMQAFAQLGPIAGAVSAALIGVTTAAEIATIVAQKNAIMNTSASSTGSNSQIGARVATGYSSGGYTTEASNDYKPVGVVHANEWVAPASMVRANPVIFRRLEQARKSGKSVSGVSGFADGGMTSAPSGQILPGQSLSLDPALLSQLVAVLQYIIDNGIPAYVLLSEINSKQELQANMKKLTGKK